MKKTVLLTAVVLMLCAFLSGCRSVVPKHAYLLMSDETISPVEGTHVQVKVSSVSLPAYISRRELVRIVDSDRVTTVPGMMWAEMLDNNVRRVLERNLERASSPDGKHVNVTFDFRHLELTDRDTLRLEAVAFAEGAKENSKTFAFETPLAGQPHAARAYGAALSTLSRQVIQWLHE
ncbi:MAG: membrane integrity-associated transporter subunit PqiC [Victivallales bacterium]|nr:membrane integrity-associated transporter subunit PqiC [Victivallales bacterium]